jgi:hypothetical protein
MPAKLTTTINKIKTVPNPTNAEIVDQFHHYMKGSDISENHQNNCLKVVIALANFLGINITFYDIKNKEQITAFLDTKVKSREEILIRNGLPHGIIIWIESGFTLGGYIMIETSEAKTLILLSWNLLYLQLILHMRQPYSLKEKTKGFNWKKMAGIMELG